MLKVTFSFIVFCLFVGTSLSCTNNQYYWISNDSLPWPTLDNAPIEDLILCGNRWHDLMLLDSYRVKEPEYRSWLLVFHQLCAATLNKQVYDSELHYAGSEVEEAIGLIRDNMERHCDNISGWPINERALRDALQILILYNSEATCETRTEFSFIGVPELFMDGYNMSCATLKQTMYYMSNTNMYMAILLGILGLFLLPVLWALVVILKKKKNEYSMIRNTKKKNKKAEEEDNEGSGHQLIELNIQNEGNRLDIESAKDK